MNICVTVREYARITTAVLETPSLDHATVSVSAFEYFCKLSIQCRKSGANLVQEESRTSLRLDNYVGVIETPCGTLLEILPKHANDASDATVSRALLRRMLEAILELPTSREVGVANIELFDSPLNEWVMAQFLAELDTLVKRGIRFDYQRIEEEQRYLCGQLNVVGQMRQGPGKQHFFQIRHDVFLPDRPENRLIKTALDKICTHTQAPESWRLAHELAGRITEIPSSRQISNDFNAWRKDRLMAHYQPIKPWCQLVLGDQMPLAIRGDTRGVSMLFPMEKLFEAYVGVCLRRNLLPGAQLKTQVASQYLCQHQEQNFFQLKPDFMLTQNGERWILDSKWKRIDETLRGYDDDQGVQKFGLNQADFYQMFAYGQKYLSGAGKMLLIYPKTEKFATALPAFYFSDELSLLVVPFDLEKGTLLSPIDIQLPLKSIEQRSNSKSI